MALKEQTTPHKLIVSAWAFTLLGALCALTLPSCHQGHRSGDSNQIASQTLPHNGPYAMNISKESCLKFASAVPQGPCIASPNSNQCWLGKDSLLTVRVLYQATEIGNNTSKYLTFQVADGLTNTLGGREGAGLSSEGGTVCTSRLINEIMENGKKVAFLWSDTVSKISNQQGQLVSMDQVDKPPADTLTSIFQLTQKGILTSRFGPRWGRQHVGIDLAWFPGTPIYAYCAGTVEFAGASDRYLGYGNIVVLKHNPSSCSGVGYTRYAHHRSVTVKTGASVRSGQQIALMGSTGRSSGPHLHFETRDKNNTPFNPLRVLSDRSAKQHPMVQIFVNGWTDKLIKEGPAWDQVLIQSSEDLATTKEALATAFGFHINNGQLPPEIATADPDTGSTFALVGPNSTQAAVAPVQSFQVFGGSQAILMPLPDGLFLELDLESTPVP